MTWYDETNQLGTSIHGYIMDCRLIITTYYANLGTKKYFILPVAYWMWPPIPLNNWRHTPEFLYYHSVVLLPGDQYPVNVYSTCSIGPISLFFRVLLIYQPFLMWPLIAVYILMYLSVYIFDYTIYQPLRSFQTIIKHVFVLHSLG